MEGVDVSQPLGPNADLEHGASHVLKEALIVERFDHSFWRKVANLGVELRGLEPVPAELRTDRRYVNILTLFTTTSIGLLPIGIGAAPTLYFGLSLRQAAPMIVFLQMLFLLPSCYILGIAPLTGMRQWCQFRYVYGKYFNMIISAFAIVATGIFAVIAAVTGAQTLASVNPNTLSVDGGIVIIMLIACFIGLSGYRVLHAFGRYAWIPAAFGLLILVGSAGENLSIQAPSRTSGAGARPWLSTISLLAGTGYAWGGIIGDYACYMPPEAPRFRLGLYFCLGLGVMFSLLMVLGAAIGGAVPLNATWLTAFENGGTGAVIGEILVARLGGFGQFVLVILALTVVITAARDIYSISFGLQAAVPYLERIPRAVFAFLTTGVMIGVAIPASRSFLSALSALVSIVSYASGITVTSYLLEWFIFRKADPASLDPTIWDNARLLPSGIPAFAAFAIAWAPVVCGMETAWYVGPLGDRVGDLGWELAMASAVVVYVPLRALELKYRGRL